MGGNCAILIKKYETQVQVQVSVKYHHNYQGGLTRYIQDYEDAFVELEALSV
jgi:hypothetical protein